MALREYHQDRFQPGELSCIEKECFFTGLRNKSKYLVSHMKDKKEYGPVGHAEGVEGKRRGPISSQYRALTRKSGRLQPECQAPRPKEGRLPSPCR